MQDSDYENPDEHSDSEMYVLPVEETGDDSYEPPPVEQETRTVHPALPFTRGEYAGEAPRAWVLGGEAGAGRGRQGPPFLPPPRGPPGHSQAVEPQLANLPV